MSNQNENVSFSGTRTGNGRNLAGMGFRSTGRGGVSLNHNNGNISAELKHILASNNTHSRKIRNNLSFNHVMNNNSPQFQSSFGNGQSIIGSKERGGSPGFKIISQNNNIVGSNGHNSSVTHAGINPKLIRYKTSNRDGSPGPPNNQRTDNSSDIGQT
jgi:hypothetical protein